MEFRVRSIGVAATDGRIPAIVAAIPKYGKGLLALVPKDKHRRVASGSGGSYYFYK